MNITRLNTLNDDKVIVKKEGGNGGGNSGGGGTEEVGILFFNISNIPQNALLQALYLSFLVNQGNQILPTSLFTYSSDGLIDNLIGVKKIAVVYGYSTQGSQESQVTESEIKSLLELIGATIITEEEFYTI